LTSAAAVLLHGRNGRPEQMLDLGRRLDLDGMRWLAPAAASGSWYPNRFTEPLSSNEPYLSQAIEQCDRAVDDAAEEGRLGPDRIALVGFSQGACLALEYALRHSGRCRALVVFTGGFIGPPGTRWSASTGRLDGTDVLITGSNLDEWVPEHRVRETAQVLTDLGADVVIRMYSRRPHVVSDEEVVEARAFLMEWLKHDHEQRADSHDARR
jgi:phospholipase/carboxylesterase